MIASVIYKSSVCIDNVERAFQKQKELDARRAENIRKIQEDARRVEKALIEQWREDDRRRKEVNGTNRDEFFLHLWHSFSP